jgi:hypothetical protein
MVHLMPLSVAGTTQRPASCDIHKLASLFIIAFRNYKRQMEKEKLQEELWGA